jgi:hypothetical protein
MHPALSQLSQQHRRLFVYDTLQRRLWILGQRCHHGATGALVAAAACIGFVAERQVARAFMVLGAAGGVLMAHDWKDHSIWFERGYGTQM